MKRILLTALAVLLLSAFTCNASAEGDGIFDLKSVDVGNISEGGSEEIEIELRNITGAPLSIEKVDTSCGCTVVNAPGTTIEAGETAKVKVTIDTRGKVGDISKELKLFTSSSGDPHVITVKGRVEHFGDRLPDPSVIFRGECASCHVGENIEEKRGKVLYNSVCYLCHKKGLSREAAGSPGLENVIAGGIPGTSMPGFSEKAGGPLDKDQVRSLVEHVRKTFD